MLNDVTVFNIREYLSDENDKMLGEAELKNILSEFSCKKNSDVERFLKEQSIDFTKKNQSVTYLVCLNKDAALVGYFTLTIKPISVKADNFSIREIPHQTRNAYRTAKTSAKKTEQAMRTAKQTIKNTEKATKETAKAIVNVVKATFTATKSLISMIIAGGWVAVFILLIIVLFGAWFAIAGGDESEQSELFSAEVIAYESVIQQYADQYGMSEYVELIKAVMMQESSGLGTDPMGSSESEYNVRYPRAPNGILEPEYSIYCAILELKDCLIEAEVENPVDIENIRLALQQYNAEVEDYDSLVLQYYIYAKKLIESHI